MPPTINNSSHSLLVDGRPPCDAKFLKGAALIIVDDPQDPNKIIIGGQPNNEEETLIPLFSFDIIACKWKIETNDFSSFYISQNGYRVDTEDDLSFWIVIKKM